MSGKYERLSAMLRRQKADEITVTFAEIEKVLVFKLPPSARKSASFWANDVTHSQARAWINEYWMTRDVSIDEQRVTFVQSPDATKESLEWSERQMMGFLEGSRGAGIKAYRDYQKKLAGVRPRVQECALRLISALEPLDCVIGFDPGPAPRSARAKRHPTCSVTALRSGKTRLPMTLTFGPKGGLITDVTLRSDLGDFGRWPADRASDAWLFIFAWERHSP